VLDLYLSVEVDIASKEVGGQYLISIILPIFDWFPENFLAFFVAMKSPKSLSFSCHFIQSIYMHLLSNLGLYVGCSSDPTISNSPKIISYISSTKLLISFMLVFDGFLCTKRTTTFFGSVEEFV